MSQVIRRWVEDHAIDNSKMDNTGAYFLGSVDATNLHISGDSTFGGSTLFTDGSFTGNVKIEGTLSARLDSTIFDQLSIEQDENQPAIIARQTGGYASPVVQLNSNGLAALIDMTCGYATILNPAVQISHLSGTRVILGPVIGSGGVVGTANASDFRIYSNNSEAIRVRPDGKVAIGNGVNPVNQLDVSGTVGAFGAIITGNVGDTVPLLQIEKASGGSSQDWLDMTTTGTATEGFRFHTDSGTKNRITPPADADLVLESGNGLGPSLTLDSDGTSIFGGNYVYMPGVTVGGFNLPPPSGGASFSGDVIASRLKVGDSPFSVLGSVVNINNTVVGDMGLLLTSSKLGADIRTGSGGSGDSTTLIVRNLANFGPIIQGRNYTAGAVFKVDYNGDVSSAGDIYSRTLEVTPGSNTGITINSGTNYSIYASNDTNRPCAQFVAGSGFTGARTSLKLVHEGASGNLLEGWYGLTGGTNTVLIDYNGNIKTAGGLDASGNISGVDMSCYRIGVGTSPSGTYAAAIYGGTKGGISTDTDLVGAYGISASGVTRGGVVGAGSGGTGDATSLIVRNNSGSGKFIKCEGYGAQEKFTIEYEGRTSIGKSFDNPYRQLDVTTGNNYRYGIVSQSEQLPAILANCNASGNNPAIVANGHNIAGFFDAGFDHIGSGDSTGLIVRSLGANGDIIEGWNYAASVYTKVFSVDHDGTVNTLGDIYSEDWTDWRSRLFNIGTGVPTSDCTGWSAIDEIESYAWYKRVGKTLHIKLDITGTSNINTIYMKMPYKMKIFTNKSHSINKFGTGLNGVALVGPCQIYASENSGMKIGISLNCTGSLGGWNSTGSKGVSIDQSFELD